MSKKATESRTEDKNKAVITLRPQNTSSKILSWRISSTNTQLLPPKNQPLEHILTWQAGIKFLPWTIVPCTNVLPLQLRGTMITCDRTEFPQFPKTAVFKIAVLKNRSNKFFRIFYDLEPTTYICNCLFLVSVPLTSVEVVWYASKAWTRS